MECSDELKPLLAGFVDGELTTVERQAVEEHVAQCADCRELLDEQRAAAEAYDQYPIEDVGDDDWDVMWASLDAELPEPTKRVDLETLASATTEEETESTEEGDAPAEAADEGDVPQIVPGEQGDAADEVVVSPEAQEPVAETEEKRVVRLPKRRPERPRVFKPLRFRRMRHTLWAHAAGIAACLLVAAMVYLSARPVIRVDDFARDGEVVVGLDFSESQGVAYQVFGGADGEGEIPLVWIVDVTDDGMIIEKGIQ